MKISIIIPFYNEEENVDPVIREVLATNPGAEVIAVDDGSHDGTAERLAAIPGIRVIRLPSNLGQSAALYRGLEAAEGDVCVMMDGDGQNDPADIPKLIALLDRADVVCGYRAHRRDTWNRRLASRLANRIRNAVLHDGIRDTGCTLKAVKKEHVRHLVPFNAMHRFMAALFKSAGLTIVEIPVNHRPRQAGVSKYTVAGRAVRGLYDLLGVRWLVSRRIHWPRT
jgi:dolichol-phosphate mannosyltransferase